jgi:hypothetical protein
VSVIKRCAKTADDGQRCIYASDHKGICSIYMPSDDRGWVFDRLWSDEQQLQGVVEAMQSALDAATRASVWKDGESLHEVVGTLTQALKRARGQLEQ